MHLPPFPHPSWQILVEAVRTPPKIPVTISSLPPTTYPITVVAPCNRGKLVTKYTSTIQSGYTEFFFFKKNLLYFSIIIYPLYTHFHLHHSTITTLLSMSMSPFSFCSIPPLPNLPRAVSLLSMNLFLFCYGKNITSPQN